MIVDGENRHYTATKNWIRLLQSLKAIQKGADHFYMNCLNGFSTASARDQLYEYSNSNCHVKVKVLFDKEKCLKCCNGELKVPFPLQADFKSILKPVEEQYRENINQMKTERKRGETAYTEKINTQVLSGWCVHSTFAYGDVLDTLKMYCCKDCVEKFVEHIKNVVKSLV